MDPEFEEFIRRAKKEYMEAGPIPCPAFDGELIYFKKSCFKHLLRKRGILRSESEQRRKLILFRHATEIIKSSITVSEYRKGEKVQVPGAGQFWALSRRFEDRLVSVVIRQIDNGHKHFFSVKDDKAKD